MDLELFFKKVAKPKAFEIRSHSQRTTPTKSILTQRRRARQAVRSTPFASSAHLREILFKKLCLHPKECKLLGENRRQVPDLLSEFDYHKPIANQDNQHIFCAFLLHHRKPISQKVAP